MRFVDILVQGVLLGGLYALYAAGLSLVFGVMRLVNLAHGDLIVAAAFLILAFTAATGLHPALALIVSLPVLFVLGYALQRLLLNHILGEDILPPMIVTFGVSIIIQNGLLEIFSADSRKLSLGPLETASVVIAPDLTVGVLPLIGFLAAVATLLALGLLLQRTPVGRLFRATSDSLEIVQLMGVDPRRMFALAMGLAFVVIGLAAFFMGLRASFDPSVGPARLIYAFEAVVMGGLGSLWGTLAGGTMLGVAQAVGGALDPEWQILAGHLLFLAVLLVRPRGLFPRR